MRSGAQCTHSNYTERKTGCRRNWGHGATIRQQRPKQILTNLFRCATNNRMQSTKPSKKTSKQANETVAAAQEVTVAADATSKPRASRSSKTKKSEPAETGTVKHHHKTVPPVITEPAVAIAEKPKAGSAPKQVAHAQIAELAHSYWVARGCAHGSAEADWLRAERELLGSR
jgi:hypothetical protein